MITLELVLFISIVGIGFNIISFWMINRLQDTHREVVQRIWVRLNYLEVGMSYHGFIPMPWEVQELEDIVEEIKTFKQEGNVVYLQKDE